MKRTRALLCLLAGLLSLSGVLVVGFLLRQPAPVRLTDGCVRYWPITAIWLCGDSVYEIQRGRKMWAGKFTDMKPTPQAKREK